MKEIHIQDYRSPDGTGRCGVEDVKTMSAHEIKRGRINCVPCLQSIQ